MKNQLLNNEQLNDNRILYIIRTGKIYLPAQQHYPTEPGKQIECVQCGKQNLEICVGLANIDICLSCVHKYSKQYENRNLDIFEFEQYNIEAPLTLMMQDSVSFSVKSIGPIENPIGKDLETNHHNQLVTHDIIIEEVD